MTSCGPRCMFARWRPASTWPSSTLRRTGCLTPDGERFLDLLHAQGQTRWSGDRTRATHRKSPPRWPSTTADLADQAPGDRAARSGEPRGRLPAGRAVPGASAAQDVDPGGHPQGRLDGPEPPAEHALPGTRAIPRPVRRREPPGSASLTASFSPGHHRGAVQAYRDRITSSADRSRTPGSGWRWRCTDSRPRHCRRRSPPGWRSFSRCTPASAAGADPLDLAGWFA